MATLNLGLVGKRAVVLATRRFSAYFSNMAYDGVNSVVSIDDDKVKHRPKSVMSAAMMRTYQRGGNPGPTLHEATSVRTEMILASYLQKHSDTTISCVQNVAQRNIKYVYND